MRLQSVASLSREGMGGVLPVLAIIGVVGGGLLAAVLGAHLLTGIPTRSFMVDPAAVTEAPFYVGWISVTGTMLWPAPPPCAC